MIRSLVMKKSVREDSLGDELSNKVLDQLPTPVMAIDKDYNLIFMNQAGFNFLGRSWDEIAGKKCYDVFCSEHCGTDDCRMRAVMKGEDPETVRNNIKIKDTVVPIEYTADSLKDSEGNAIGGLEYIIDITETVKKSRNLNSRAEPLWKSPHRLSSFGIESLFFRLWVWVDSFRAMQMMDTMLNKLKETSSKIIILDIQGVAAVDTAVANHLIKIAKATRLMGCQCIISGISPAVAQTLVQLGIEMVNILTTSDLQEALADAFEIMNFEVKKRE